MNKARKLDISPVVVAARCAITFPKPPAKKVVKYAVKEPFTAYMPKDTMVGVTAASDKLGVPVPVLVDALERTGRFTLNRRGHEWTYSLKLWEFVASLAGVSPRLSDKIRAAPLEYVADVRSIYDSCGRRPQNQEAA